MDNEKKKRPRRAKQTRTDKLHNQLKGGVETGLDDVTSYTPIACGYAIGKTSLMLDILIRMTQKNKDNGTN